MVAKSIDLSTGNPGGCPLKGFKSGVLESHHNTKMKAYIYESGNDWDMAALNFAWRYQGAVINGASNCELTFSDMNMLSYGFGPEKEVISHMYY
jgi:hypothetical protein